MQRVTIVGSGFGALTSVQTLREAGFKGELSVVSPRAGVRLLSGTDLGAIWSAFG